jgi:hypothetical protein
MNKVLLVKHTHKGPCNARTRGHTGRSIHILLHIAKIDLFLTGCPDILVHHIYNFFVVNSMEWDCSKQL